MECFRHDSQLRELGKRLDTWDNRNRNAHLPSLLHEVEVFSVVKEQLRHGILRTQVLLLLQVLHVEFQIGSLLMFLGIASHTILEGNARFLDGSAVYEESLVESVDLLYQLRRMGVSVLDRLECLVVFRLVASQQQEVGDAQELQVEQFIFYVFRRGTAANHVGNHGYVVFVLDGSCNGDCAWSPAYALTLKVAIFQLLKHVFAVVRGDIDEERVKVFQFVNRGKECICARPLEWREHFE